MKKAINEERQRRRYISLPSTEERTNMLLATWGEHTQLVDSIPPEYSRTKESMINYLQSRYPSEAARVRAIYKDRVDEIERTYRAQEGEFKPVAEAIRAGISLGFEWKIEDQK